MSFQEEQTFDVRVDPEQEVKYTESCELLVAAGYFRARIATLSAFDKIVGGLAWCITNSNYEINTDMDFLFQQSFTIGSKIALTEKLIDSLRTEMNCPHSLSPHQIQGLDCINIFPVLQWLVKKVIQARKEKGDENRKISSFYFNQNYKTKVDIENIDKDIIAESAYGLIKSTFAPKRKYRKLQTTQNKLDRAERAQATLTEYGSSLVLSHSIEANQNKEKQNDQRNKNNKKQKFDKTKHEEMRKNAENTLNDIMKEMIESKHTQSSPVTAIDIVSGQSKKIASDFVKSQGAMQSDSGKNMFSQLKIQEVLNKQIASAEIKLKEVQTKELEIEYQHKDKESELNKITKYLGRIELETQKLDDDIGEEKKEMIAKAQKSVALYKALQKEEKLFKEECKKKRGELLAEIKDIKSEIEDELWLNHIKTADEKFVKETERYNLIRREFAKTNLEIANYQRRVDDIPTRIELLQYQKRFMELFLQIQNKHLETKHFYSLFNMLSDTKDYMEKEINLLESIHTSFLQAMNSKSQKQQFISQMDTIVNGVLRLLKKVETQYGKIKEEKDSLNDNLLKLLEKERRYFKLVKEFQMECNENEKLLKLQAQRQQK